MARSRAIAAQRERLIREADQLAAARAAVAAERPPLEAAVKAAERELRGAATGALEAARERPARGRTRATARADSASSASAASWRRSGSGSPTTWSWTNPATLLDRGDRDPPEGRGRTRRETEREIARLKERLRRVGYVGENAVEEYEREAERHAFLRAQLDDVAGAAAALHAAAGRPPRDDAGALRRDLRAGLGGLHRDVHHPLRRRHGAAGADRRARTATARPAGSTSSPNRPASGCRAWRSSPAASGR